MFVNCWIDAAPYGRHLQQNLLSAEQEHYASNMQVLITGITGFVGSHLARALVRERHQVRGLVRTPNARGHLAPDVQVELVQGEITQPATLPAALRGVNAIAHLVAI